MAARVVVTGMGLVTPLGRNVRETWEGVRAGGTGIAHQPQPGRPDYLQYFGKVDGLERNEDIPAKLSSQVRFLNRASILGFEAAREALTSSGINLPAVPRERRALFLASGDLTNVGYEFMHPALRDVARANAPQIDYSVLNKSTVGKVNPFFLLESISNNLFSFLSAAFEFMGPNTSIASFSPCGTQAMELAARKIRCGQVDAALAVGCANWITEIPLYELEGMGLLSKCRNGAQSFRPFDRARDGFIAGEGGAALLLEEAESARARGARILAEIKGCGNCIEFPAENALGVPETITGRCIEMALEEASCGPEELAFIIPYGSGAPEGDRSELRSIAAVLGGRKSGVPICGLKPYTGHMGAASDLAEIALAILAGSEGTAPGTPNFREADSEFAELKIAASPQSVCGGRFLTVSYGVLGQSSSILVESSGF